MNPLLKNDINDLMKDVPYSSIPIDPPKEEPRGAIPDLNVVCKETLGSKSNDLIDSYKYGEGLAKFNKIDSSIQCLCKNIPISISSIISNELYKQGISAESLRPQYEILNHCFTLIFKDLEKKGVTDPIVFNIIASLQGFINNYNKKEKNI